MGHSLNYQKSEQPTPQAMKNPETSIPLTHVTLYTDETGVSQFREDLIPLSEGSEQVTLSALKGSGGFQLRQSPVGFKSEFHCTDKPQFVFILSGEMEISLQNGQSRFFKPGDYFFSADCLPSDTLFDSRVHGHKSRQVGSVPLTTLFVRTNG